MKSFPRLRLDQRGVVIIWTAFFLVFMLGFVALGIDVAKVMTTRTQLQNAADAAALAGATGIDLKTGEIIPDTAVVRAQFTAARNKAFVNEPLPVQLLAAEVTFPTPTQVKVVVHRSSTTGGSMVTHVAQVLGITALELSATATAEVDEVSAPCEGLVPMAPIEDTTGPWFDPDCSRTYSLKVDAGSGTQGNYQLLDYPPCEEGPCQDVGGGGAEIRCLAENGYGCCLNLGDEYVATQPGNKVGPFRQGMQARFDADTDRRENICFSEYRGNGKRIINVPIVESFDVNGKKLVKIVAFSAFFIKYRPTGSGDMRGQFVNNIVPGDPGGPTGSTLFSIRLVK